MTTSDHKAITDVLHRVDATWAANDADAFADLYRADGTVVLPGRNLVRASIGWWTNDDDLQRLLAGIV